MSAPGAPIEGRLRMSEDDVLAGLHAMMPYLRFRWAYLAVVAVGAAVGVATGDLVKQPLSYLPFLGVNAAIILWAFFGPRSMARKHARAQRFDEGDVSFRFDDEGVALHTPGSTVTTAYRTIPGWREIGSAFLINCGPNAASIVPKRAFATGDVDRVRALLAANVKAVASPARKAVRRAFILWVALIFAFLVIWQLFSGQPMQQRGPATPPPTGEPR